MALSTNLVQFSFFFQITRERILFVQIDQIHRVLQLK
jgi:hypothetical protein